MSNTAKVVSFPGRAREGVMVCLSSNASGAEILLRKASKAAAELDANWYAVHVDTTIGDKTGAPDSGFRALLDGVVLAADLGAEAVWLKAPDVTEALARLRPRRAGDADYRRPRPPWTGRAPAPSFGNRRPDRARSRVRNRSSGSRQAREESLSSGSLSHNSPWGREPELNSPSQWGGRPCPPRRHPWLGSMAGTPAPPKPAPIS